jgi:hypothetical protein
MNEKSEVVLVARKPTDILEYEWSDGLGGINLPKLLSKGGFHSISELSDCQLVGCSVRVIILSV